MIKLNTVVSDTQTKFTGLAVSRTQYLDDCVRIGIRPTELKDDIPQETIFIDELQLREVNTLPPSPKYSRMGTICEDRVTGYKGMVVCHTEYIHAGARVTLQSKKLFEGRPVPEHSIDESQLVGYTPEAVKPGMIAKTFGPGDHAPRTKSPSRF